MELSSQQIRYCAETRAVLGAQRILVRNPVTARTIAADRSTVAMVSACATFASVEEHCARLEATSGQDRSQCIAGLKRAIDAGLFVSAAQSRALASQLAPVTKPCRIDCIGIPTRNRPKLLNRLLSGLAWHLRQYGRDATVVVIDDSDDVTAQRANASIALAYSGDPHFRVRYIDGESRRRFVEQLARGAGVPIGTVAFALMGSKEYPVSIGAARNAMLLYGAGRNLLLLDDDVQCRIAEVPGSSEQLHLADGGLDDSFFTSLDEIDRCRFVDQDIVGLHERILNIGPADILSDRGAVVDVISHTTGKRLASGGAGVIISQMGIVGDCGLDSPFGYYLSEPEMWSRLVRSGDLYRTAIRNRLILRGSKSYRVTHESHSQAHCLGLNNTRGLPPFLPVMRGEDGVFGHLVSKCVPDSLFGLIPRAILHCPEPAREFLPQAAVSSAGRFSLAETVMALISATGAGTSPTFPERVQSLGRSLLEVRSARDEDLRERIHWALEPLLIRLLQTVERRLEGSCAGDCWVEDVRQIRDAALDGLNSINHLGPADLEEIFGRAAVPGRLRSVVGQFAELLQAWPALVESAEKQQE